MAYSWLPHHQPNVRVALIQNLLNQFSDSQSAEPNFWFTIWTKFLIYNLNQYPDSQSAPVFCFTIETNFIDSQSEPIFLFTISTNFLIHNLNQISHLQFYPNQVSNLQSEPVFWFKIWTSLLIIFLDLIFLAHLRFPN